MLRRNRLTPRPSGRLRRRLTQALVGSSCGFFVWCVSSSFALVCRLSPQQISAQRRRKPGHSELVVLGNRLFKLRARLGSCCRPSMQRRNRLTSHSSGRLRRRLTPALGVNMDSFEVWKALQVQYPDRTERVADKIAPTSPALQDFLDHLQDMRQLAWVAHEKCGTIGNPYEKPAEDLAILQEAAQRISGQRARFRWERA